MNPILKVICAIIIIIGIFFVSVVIGVIVDEVNGKEIDISDGRQSLSVSVSKNSGTGTSQEDGTKRKTNSNEIEINSDKLSWYSTLYEAMKDTSLISDHYFFKGYGNDPSNLIAEIKDKDGRDDIIYASPTKKGTGVFVEYAEIYYKDGKYSQPYNIGYNFIDYSHTGEYKYDFDDNISQELTMEYALGPQIIAENGNQVFYGSWGDQKEIESMTIDGHKPDKIMSYVIHGKKRYFWYYTQTDLAAKLKTIDYSNYTLQQVTDLIGIKYDLDTSVVNAKDKY